MSKRNLLRRLKAEAPTLTTLAVAAVALFAVCAPASAQFFDFFGRPPPRPQQGMQQQYQPRSGGFFGGFFPGGAPAQPQQQRAVDYSHAPPPEKRETVPERYVLVLGDAMADWLAYGLEDAFAEQDPDLGVIRRHKTNSGLIRYQPKGEPADWLAAAKGILATEKPDAIVVMLGLNDRMSIRAEKTDAKPGADKDKADKDKKDAGNTKPGESTKPGEGKAADGKNDAKSDSKADEPAADEADGETPPVAAADKSARAGGTFEFRDDHWSELYARKIEDFVAVLKSKGVPVIWVGLPAVRGPKATSDMLFLDAIYRDEAGKAGITYVDVWDGFVDEAGRFMPQGPDFQGQIRRLRSPDGVFFTKAGARKLAHYVEREVTRLLAGRSAPLALPNEPAAPEVNARPGGPAPRPLLGPVVPLVASSIGTDELLGGPGTRPAAVDALAARTLVKGDPLAAPAGRADDYAWPRRDVVRFDPSKEGAPVATTEPAKTETPAKPEARTDAKPDTPAAILSPDATAPAAPSPLRRKRVQQQPQPSTGFFGFNTQPPAAAAPAKPRPLVPRDGAPRPPAAIGRSASAPDSFLMR